MPDAEGNLKGQGWSRKREEGWERAFGRNPSASGSDSSGGQWCPQCGRERAYVRPCKDCPYG